MRYKLYRIDKSKNDQLYLEDLHTNFEGEETEVQEYCEDMMIENPDYIYTYRKI